MAMPGGLGVPITRGEQNHVREAFSRQPVRALVIDAVVPSNEKSIDDLIEAIKQLFAIICSLRGPTRIPGVSILVSHTKADVLLPMQKVAKPLYGRILSSLDQISVVPAMNWMKECRPKQENTSLEQALVCAINDFRKFKELSGFREQLEISVFSHKNARFLQSFASSTIQNLNSDDVKGIEFISLTRCSESLLSQCTGTFDHDLSSQSDDQSKFACLWNILQIESNAVSIQWHMRHWFKDECSDKEHLRLTIKDMEIKCDLQQRFVNPNAFSFKHFYSLPGDQGLHGNAGSRAVQNKPEAIPILQMRAKAMIDQSGICDSLVFGSPVVLVSSSCWKMEWDELDCNQDRFSAMCRTLLDQHQCLLCEDITQHPSRHRNYSNGQSVQPRGIYIILPSNTSSMLLKSVVPRELLLPTGTDSLSEKRNFSSSVIEDVRSAIGSLEKINVYNPLHHPCGLYETLNASLLPKFSAKFSKNDNNTMGALQFS